MRLYSSQSGVTSALPPSFFVRLHFLLAQKSPLEVVFRFATFRPFAQCNCTFHQTQKMQLPFFSSVFALFFLTIAPDQTGPKNPVYKISSANMAAVSRGAQDRAAVSSFGLYKQPKA
jgi:hypothetical protein